VRALVVLFFAEHARTSSALAVAFAIINCVEVVMCSSSFPAIIAYILLPLKSLNKFISSFFIMC
jgi:hypothetical protein